MRSSQATMNKQRIPSALALMSTACLAASLLIVSDGCTQITNTTAVQCLSEAECLERGPDFANTTCSAATKTCVPVVQGVGLCSTNVECIARNGGTNSICRKRDKRCVVLQTAECPVIHGSKTEIENDKTIFVGLIDPGSAGPLGLLFNTITKFVQEDLALQTTGLPSVDGTPGTRPVVFVSCNEFGAGFEGLQRGARHLVDDVGVPAVVGPVDPENVLRVLAPIFLPNKIMSIAPTTFLSALNDLPNPIAPTPLIWRPQISDSVLVKVVAPFVKDVAAQKTIDMGIRTAGEPLRVLVLVEGNVQGIALQRRVQDILVFNDKSAVQNSLDMPPTYTVSNFGDFNDPTNNSNPTKKITSSLEQVFAFKPHVIVHSANVLTLPRVLGPLEALWPASSGPKPLHVSMNGSWLSERLFKIMATDVTLRSRIFIGLAKPAAGTDRLQTMFLNFKQRFPEFSTAATNPLVANIYDSAYLMIYALAAVGSKPLTGENIAVAMGRLQPPGTEILTEPDQFAKGFGVLAGGGNVDLVGLSGGLNFDNEGGVQGDAEIQCANVVNGNLMGFKGSKYSYSVAKKAAGFDTGVTKVDCP